MIQDSDFRDILNWDQILKLYGIDEDRGAALSSYESILLSAEQWASKVLSNRAPELESSGAGHLHRGRVVMSKPLQKTWNEAVSMGLFSLCVDPQYGGMGVPLSVGLLIFTQISKACLATSAQMAFTWSFADMLERFAKSEIREKWVPLLAQGTLSGSMCITEPGAGSDVGSISTTAEKHYDGTYLINGSKCFITNAGGGLALILARVKGAAPGLKGLSLFFASQSIEGSEQPNYRVTKIEEKMGMKGSATCEVVYENTKAELIGQEGEGFQMMLHLMNEARISVGLQGLGVAQAALDIVKEYAQTRQQFGKSLMELPLYRHQYHQWEVECEAWRIFMLDTVSHFDQYQKIHFNRSRNSEGRENEKNNQEYERLRSIVRRRTPLAKYYGSELGARITQKAIQALGGYGFMNEYKVERLHRDAIGGLLYEGTSQIQSLMAMKDFAKEVSSQMNGKPMTFIKNMIASHPIRARRFRSRNAIHAQLKYRFQKASAILMLRSHRKPEFLMQHAETLCESLAMLEILSVLEDHSSRLPRLKTIYEEYLAIAKPRFAAALESWK